MRNLIILFIIFSIIGCKKKNEQKEILKKDLKKEKEVPSIIIPDEEYEEDKMEVFDEGYEEILEEKEKIEKKIEINEGERCNENGKRKCLTPGNEIEGSPYYFECVQDNEKPFPVWKLKMCKKDEFTIVNEEKDKYFILKTKRAICQENQKGVFCCPSDSIPSLSLCMNYLKKECIYDPDIFEDYIVQCDFGYTFDTKDYAYFQEGENCMYFETIEACIKLDEDPPPHIPCIYENGEPKCAFPKE